VTPNQSASSESCHYRLAHRRDSIEIVHETFEHTADLGLRIRAPDLNTLFQEAAQALFSVIVEDLSVVKPRQRFEIQLASDNLEYLLFDWLRELLYRFDTEHLLCCGFDVEVKDGALTATVHGECMDRQQHTMLHEVKAITYHQLCVEQENDGWLAEVIVDI
jgi:SHS2 domain-containing protein